MLSTRLMGNVLQSDCLAWNAHSQLKKAEGGTLWCCIMCVGVVISKHLPCPTCNPYPATQLTNWLKYLDYIEAKSDTTAIIILYERCLVPCASYPGEWCCQCAAMCRGGGTKHHAAASAKQCQLQLRLAMLFMLLLLSTKRAQ